MKYIIIILSITLHNCGSQNFEKTYQTIDEVEKMSEEVINFKEEYIFEFDAVDHYQIDYYNDEIFNLLTKDSLNQKEKFNVQVLNKYKHSDTTFIDSLEMIGFVKNHVSSSKLPDINELFKTQYVSENSMTMCEPIFRDVLVFRKNSKNVGIAKICFSCDKHSILGSSIPSSSFGQNGNYQKLKEILEK